LHQNPALDSGPAKRTASLQATVTEKPIASLAQVLE
jgi:hypothetical protein